MSEGFDRGGARPSYPAFRAPGVLVGLVALLFGIHLARGFLSGEADFQLILTFALFPARYAPTVDGAVYSFPGGLWADLWTPVTYAFLHADWLHLIFNSVWLMAFGTPVARRLGAVRFISFYLLCGVIAGVAYAGAQAGSLAPVVGASGAISGVIAGAALFVFERSGPLARFGFDYSAEALRAVPRRPAHKALAGGQALVFSAVWLGLTLLTGLIGLGAAGESANIAWEAHVAGFIAGILFFPRFDPGVASEE
ncbi:rhomboid family intramembrane serine protease [Pyruvatibacter mobilis]|uniref:Rhomboid family intramembrane serine protease n=1 Tax=Pyruvatibacter mobilis TaxID=1712261 RepID=A0A845QFF1_9HYPH|nr:rhomboid family intramembrane serine protease [Pyruvatibacter mobilis]NBG96876.1 rhomboid family intramembrane serine protease [Pyruvatibacter mobilis]QJD74744.1 rhomboid family intramembrane serine protease [Pyruvatibacter mobilis]GGD09767.1 rhomboid family intramembrane serine protease [Pyruvatibacter mobilis]